MAKIKRFVVSCILKTMEPFIIYFCILQIGEEKERLENKI